jgi:mannose-6-phosphate isomerase-like protein (cupin superfamily)
MREVSKSSTIEIAPDGSRVRLLMRTRNASVIQCWLAPGAVSRAVRHRSVEEIWYCLQGIGQLWRSAANGAQTDALVPGAIFNIDAGTCFQFRNDGRDDLEILITTIPPWPGGHEAEMCEPCWAPNV